ncbi:MAG: hypothetical protein KGN77_05165 [Xanthomonadaceae bacterium]|nr:hypothetical protein [Xanthomonadaceae bacterium]
MPDLPETNAGLDFEKTKAADEQAIAAERRRRLAAERKLADRAEAQLAKVEASNLSVSDAVRHGNYESQPGYMQSLVDSYTPSATSGAGGYRRSDASAAVGIARQKDMALEAEANRVAADFSNDQAVQRDREREAAQAAEELSKEFHTATTAAGVMVSAMGTVAQAMNDLAKNRAEGAKTVGDTRQSIAESIQAMGGKNAQDVIDRAERGGFGAGVTPQDVAKLLAERAAYMRSNPMAPPMLGETLDVIADTGAQHRSLADASAILSQPFPGVARTLQDAQRHGMRTPLGAQLYRGDAAGRETDVYQAQAGKFRQGIKRLDEEARIRALAVHDALGAAGAAAYSQFGNVMDFGDGDDTAKTIGQMTAANPGMTARQAAHLIELQRQQLHEARKANSAPPSTTGGR